MCFNFKYCILQIPKDCQASTSDKTMFDKQDLIKIANMEMPFGKYKGKTLIQLPEEYLLWFVDRGFPNGQLGYLMQLTLEIKINGLDEIIHPLKGKWQGKPAEQELDVDNTNEREPN